MSLTQYIPGPAYRIQTSRLLIRCWEPKDAVMLHAALVLNLDHLLPWMEWAKQEPLDLQARIDLLRMWRGNFDHDLDYEYGIFNPIGTQLIGACGLHTRLGKDVRGIGYWIHKGQLNQGFATEAASALTRVANEVDHVIRVEINCEPDNLASASIPRKLGFTHEATFHHRIMDGYGKLHDSMTWTLFSENYPTSWAAKARIEAFDAVGRNIL